MVDSATEAVETTMFRALAVLRVVVLLNALALNLWRWDDVVRPALAGVVVLVLVGWTGFVVWAYDDPARRRPPLLLADLAVTVAAIVSTPFVRAEVDSTVPAFWTMGVVLAWGVRWHWVGGLVAALVVSVADTLVRPDMTQSSWGNVFLLVIGGPLLGYTSGLLKEMAAARDRAEREAAAADERARLARVVHDGVLQVLALVQRRGAEIGGEAAELGRLAGEQEVALRALVQGRASAPAGDGDVTASLRALAGPRVTVSVPGEPVRLPPSRAADLVAAVTACLDNVERHAGPQARAWVLLEDLGDEVVVTVRDDGPGIPAGRLDEAAAAGRLGVRESVCGRLTDLGGSARLATAPGQGTEWELAVPR